MAAVHQLILTYWEQTLYFGSGELLIWHLHKGAEVQPAQFEYNFKEYLKDKSSKSHNIALQYVLCSQ